MEFPIMPTITVMAWNIENLGDVKLDPNRAGDALVDYIANVVSYNEADIVAIQEVRSNMGADLVQRLAAELDGYTSPNVWKGQESPQFCNQRLEQYVFLWDTRKVDLYSVAINGTPGSFQYQYANPNFGQPNQPQWLGFPKQIASNRPPYLAYFQTVQAPNVQIPVAVFHAPGPGYWIGVRDACKNLAQVTEFATQGHSLVIMGDFNVKSDNSVSVAGSFGEQAYGPLAGAAGTFTQLLEDVLSSLIKLKSATIGMTIADAYSQPYDTIFLRKNTNNIASLGEGIDELLEESLNGNLSGSLEEIEGQLNGMKPIYTNPADVFHDYRLYVSDHVPIVVEISF